MVAAFVDNWELLVSKQRLDRYRPHDRDDLETLVLYLFNISLSESLMQGIAAVEIALRNAVHHAFTDHAGSELWFWTLLQRNDLKVVNDKWLRLASVHKMPPTAGKIIADLTFGFWPFLFEHRYHQLWWENGEALLKTVFPYLPTGTPPHQKIGRAEIHERLRLFVELRNRVMHHEPIVFGIPRPDFGSPVPVVSVSAAHQQMVDVLGWIHPQHATTLSIVDRFPDVDQNESGFVFEHGSSACSTLLNNRSCEFTAGCRRRSGRFRPAGRRPPPGSRR